MTLMKRLPLRSNSLIEPRSSATMALRRVVSTTALATGVIAGMMLFQPGAAQAQSIWVGTTADYGTATNWNPNTVATGGVAGVFDNTVGAGSTIVDLGAATFTPDTWTINGNTAFTIQNGTANFTGGGLTNNSSANQTISAILGGATAGVTQAGAGTLTLTGANTYDGVTTITTGVVNIQNATALGSTVGGTTVAAGAALQIQGGITVGAEALTLNGTGVAADGALRNISGDNTYGGAITLGSASRINSDAGTLSLTGGITGAFDLTVGGAGNTTISSVIGTGTGGLTKDGAGTLTLTGANTYDGVTTITTGVVNIQNATALGSTVGGTTVASGAALQIQGGITVGAEALTLNGTGIAADGALRNISGDNIYGGAITLASASRINSDAGTLTLSGGITGAFDLTVGGAGNTTISSVVGTGAGTLTKDGAGTLTLTAANTYTGVTTITAGVVNIQNATALGTTAGGTTVAAGAALQIQGSITVGAEALTLNGTGVAADGALRNISGDNIYGGAITLGSASRINSDAGTLTLSGGITGAFDLTVGGAGNTTISSVVGTGAGALVKDGAGTLVLSAANTFSGGSTVSAGTLQITGAGSLASGVVVNTSATLTSAGTITGAVTNSGTANTTGTITGAVTNNSAFNASGTIGGAIVNNAGTFTVTGALTDASTFTNNTGATLAVTGGNFTGLAGLTNSGTVTIGDGRTLSAGTINNNAGTISIGAGATLNGTANTLNNAATINVATGGAITDAGAVNNLATGVINFNGPGGTATLSAAGNTFNNGVINVVSGNVAVTGNITNQGTGQIAVTGGNLTGITTLTNNSTSATAVTVGAGNTLSATTSIANNAGTFTNAGTVTAPTLSNAATFTSTGIVNATTLFTNTGTANLAGTVTTPQLNNSGTLNVVGGNLTINGPVTNTGTVALTAGRTLAVGAFNNAGTLNLQNNVANNFVTIGGAYTGNGGVLLDVDIAAARADRIAITGGGSSGSAAVGINQVIGFGAGLGVTQNDILVISGASGAQFRASNGVASATPSPFIGGGGQLLSGSNSIVQYWFGETSPGSGTFVVRPDLNVAAASSFVASVSSALSSINAYSEPASAFISGPSDPGPNTFSIGSWGRGRGGRFDTDSSSRVSSAGGVTRSFDLTNRTDFNGFQLGMDFGLYNINGTGWTANLGVHGGKVDARVRAPDVALDLSQPFYGVYGALRNSSGLAFDVLVRRDHFDMELTSQAANLQKQKFKAEGWSGLASLSQRFNITDSIYIDPSVAILYSRAEVDQLRVGADSTVAWQPIESITGRVGIQVGTFFQPTSEIVVAPYVALSAWREFSGRTEATGTFGSVSFPTTTNRIGTYGQASLGVAVSSVTPGLSGFFRGDLRFGDRVEGYAFNGGLRYQF